MVMIVMMKTLRLGVDDDSNNNDDRAARLFPAWPVTYYAQSIAVSTAVLRCKTVEQ